MKQKERERGREREGRGEGEGGSLGETVVSSAGTHLHTSCHGSSTQPTWWHHLVGLSGWEGGEREGKERGEEGPIILYTVIVNLPSQLEQKGIQLHDSLLPWQLDSTHKLRTKWPGAITASSSVPLLVANI